MKLTLEQSAYFDTMDALFMSEGWRLFVDDVKGWHEALLEQFEGVTDLRSLGIAQGRRMMAQQIISYQEVIEAGRKSIEDAPEVQVELHETDV